MPSHKVFEFIKHLLAHNHKRETIIKALERRHVHGHKNISFHGWFVATKGLLISILKLGLLCNIEIKNGLQVLGRCLPFVLLSPSSSCGEFIFMTSSLKSTNNSSPDDNGAVSKAQPCHDVCLTYIKKLQRQPHAVRSLWIILHDKQNKAHNSQLFQLPPAREKMI